MSVQILSNLNYPIASIINQELQNADKSQIAVAFLKYSGIKVIEKSLLQCIKNRGHVELICGLDFKTTEPKAMRYFINLGKQYQNVNFYCFSDKKKGNTSIVFHPKMYLFEKKKEKTGIVGSSNFTHGGLISNFEVNTIFKENKPVYFSQLQAIYNSVKYTESVFSPDENYLKAYSDVYFQFSKDDSIASDSAQDIIRDIQEKETVLPGTVPSLKAIIIEVIKKELKLHKEHYQEGETSFVKLEKIYKGCEELVQKNENLNYKMDTFKNTIRGELNHHVEEIKRDRGRQLFIRSKKKKGHYALTENGIHYQGR